MTHCLAFLPHSSIAGIAYLHSRTSALTDLENAYFALTDDVKFACGLVFVCIVYYGFSFSSYRIEYRSWKWGCS
jgi:F0F1-type ATP synthase assembly protein I